MSDVDGAWERLAGLALKIEACELELCEAGLSGSFVRKTTLIRFGGAGAEGVGEDVTYDPADHEALALASQAGEGWLAEVGSSTRHGREALAGTFTLAGFSERLEELDLFAVKAPADEVYRRYRRWGFESAALDLALRQAGTTLHDALGIEPSPVRFVASVRLGEPPSLQPLRRRLSIAPDMRFKLDPTPSWDDAVIAEIAALDAVDCVDLKGFYKGTIVDNPADPSLYKRVAEAFADAWIEDPTLTPETEAALSAHSDRVTWDAPIHSLGDIEALKREPRGLNVKPSRIGSVKELLSIYAHCKRHAIRCYGGGQSELSVGRGQIEYLASLFHPDAPNDVAPSAWNLDDPPQSLKGSPLPAKPSGGFRWA